MIILEYTLNIHTESSHQRSAFTYRDRQYMTTPNQSLCVDNSSEGCLN